MFLWFWMMVLVVITGSAVVSNFSTATHSFYSGFSLLYSAFLLSAPSVRNMMLRSRAAHQGLATAALDEVTRKLQMGDWKLLHILGMNMEPLVFGELVVELAEQMRDAKPNTREKEIGQTKTLLTEI